MKGRLPKTTRPTTGRAREALFNLLQSRTDLVGAACLDLFSGTGAVAVQCAERGANIVHAVEIHRLLARKIEEKLAKVPGAESKVFATNAMDFILRPPARYDFVFADPPYAFVGKETLVAGCLGVLNPAGLMVLEHPFYEGFDGVPGFKETRRYGLGAFSFFFPPNSE